MTLSGPAKRTLVLGLLTALTAVALRPIFAFAQLFNGDDIRDGWLTGLISLGGFCATFFFGIVCGIGTIGSAMSAITSEHQADRNAARIGLGLVGLRVLALLWDQLQQRAS